MDVTRRVRMCGDYTPDHSIFIPDPPKSARIWHYKSPKPVKPKDYGMCDEKFDNAVRTLRKGYSKIRDAREKKSIKLVEYIKPPPPSMKSKPANANTSVRCAATTMKGKPCPFKATCGKFCKKHKL